MDTLEIYIVDMLLFSQIARFCIEHCRSEERKEYFMKKFVDLFGKKKTATYDKQELCDVLECFVS